MNFYAPSWGFGGPVRMMFEYAKWMKESFDVIIYSGDVHHDFSKIEKTVAHIDGIKVLHFKLFFRSLAKKSFFLFTPIMFLSLLKVVVKNKERIIIHICDLRGLISLYVILLKLLFGKNILIIHSAFGMLHYKKSLFRTIYDYFFMKLFLRAVDISLAQNSHEKTEYELLLKSFKVKSNEKINLLPLHVSSDLSSVMKFDGLLKNKTSVHELRNKYQIPLDSKIFIFLGRFHPEKGILRTIDSFVHYYSKYSDSIYLLIVGRDDGYLDTIENYILKNKISDKVRVVTNVYENRFEYYYISDLFLAMPTIFEETMLASVEALSCGTPIIVSKEADIPFVDEGKAGFVLEYDLNSTTEMIHKIISDKLGYQQRAKLIAQQYFDETSAKNIFLSLLNKNGLL